MKLNALDWVVIAAVAVVVVLLAQRLFSDKPDPGLPDRK